MVREAGQESRTDDAGSARETPVMRQYRELKEQHPDTILFFRIGDFYETFNEDAELVSRELEIVLTSRSKVVTTVSLLPVFRTTPLMDILQNLLVKATGLRSANRSGTRRPRKAL